MRQMIIDGKLAKSLVKLQKFFVGEPVLFALASL
jgi:hypothetical protein